MSNVSSIPPCVSVYNVPAPNNMVPLRLLSGQTIVVRCFWLIAKFAAHPCASVIYDHTKTGHPGLQTVLIPWLQKLGSAAASIARSSWVRGTGCIVPYSIKGEGRVGLV